MLCCDWSLRKVAELGRHVIGSVVGVLYPEPVYFAFCIRMPVLAGTTLSWQQAECVEFQLKNSMLMVTLNRSQSKLAASLPQD